MIGAGTVPLYVHASMSAVAHLDQTLLDSHLDLTDRSRGEVVGSGRKGVQVEGIRAELFGRAIDIAV
jgi:hypothetical protein